MLAVRPTHLPITHMVLLGALFSFVLNGTAQTELPVIYALQSHSDSNGHKTHFVSLLEEGSAWTDDHTSVSIMTPQMRNLGKGASPYQRFYDSPPLKIAQPHRMELLDLAGISEQDSLFAYCMQADTLVAFAVSTLPAVAVMNPYADQPPFEPQDFMVGLSMGDQLIKTLGEWYCNTLVYIGPENPFQTGQLQPLLFTPMDGEKFPQDKVSLELLKEHTWGDAYAAKHGHYNVFVREMVYKELRSRLTLVMDEQTGEKLFERIFMDSESTSPSPLILAGQDTNLDPVQYIGNLFKDMPPHLSGMLWHSFGCPGIYFMDDALSVIQIRCDNRH